MDSDEPRQQGRESVACLPAGDRYVSDIPAPMIIAIFPFQPCLGLSQILCSWNPNPNTLIFNLLDESSQLWEACKNFAAKSWVSSLILELQVHFHNCQAGKTHEPPLNDIVEMHDLDSLIVHSVPLRDILESTDHSLLSKLVRDRDNLEVEPPTQYAG